VTNAAGIGRKTRGVATPETTPDDTSAAARGGSADPTPEPTRHLAPAARWLWRLQGLMAAVAAVVVARAATDVAPAWLRSAAALLVAIVAVGVIPELRWRRWRYDVRELEIDIRRGVFKVTRRLIPMLRVQHVDTTRGILEQLFGLSTVVVHTAAGETTIPALDEGEAAALRDRIAVLARTPDDL